MKVLFGKVRRHVPDRAFNDVLRHLPGKLGARWRMVWLRRFAREIGEGCSVGQGVILLNIRNLRLGTGVGVPRDSTLDARGGLVVEDEALIGFESVILTRTHNSDRTDVSIQSQGMHDAPVRIGRRAWLGTRVVVVPGVTIGEGAIVGSGAVVTGDVAPFDVVAGVPARRIRNRLQPASGDGD